MVYLEVSSGTFAANDDGGFMTRESGPRRWTGFGMIVLKE